MTKFLTLAVLAALVASPAMAKTHKGSLARARAQVERTVPLNAYGSAYGPAGVVGGGYYNGYPAEDYYRQRDSW